MCLLMFPSSNWLSDVPKPSFLPNREVVFVRAARTFISLWWLSSFEPPVPPAGWGPWTAASLPLGILQGEAGKEV